MNFLRTAAVAVVISLTGVPSAFAEGMLEFPGVVNVKSDVNLATMLGYPSGHLTALALEVQRLTPELEIPSFAGGGTELTIAADAVVGNKSVYCTDTVVFDREVGYYRPDTKPVPWCNYDLFDAIFIG